MWRYFVILVHNTCLILPLVRRKCEALRKYDTEGTEQRLRQAAGGRGPQGTLEGCLLIGVTSRESSYLNRGVAG